MLSLEENADLVEKFKRSDYKYRSERIMVFQVKAFDGICPQHITHKYTLEEVEQILNSQAT